MDKLTKSSIARATILPVACVLAAIAGLAIIFLGSENKERTARGLIEKATLTARVLAPIAAAAAWQFDAQAGERLLQSLATDLDFASGFIVDDKGQIFAQFQNQPAQIAPMTLEEAHALLGSAGAQELTVIEEHSFIQHDRAIIVVPLVMRDKAAKIGYMALSFSRARANAAALAEIFAIAITGTFTLLTVCALLVLIVSRVTRPIRKLTETMNQLSSGEHDTAIPALDRSDEIGTMARALAVLRDNSVERLRLEHLTTRLQQTTEELRREGEKVTHLANHDTLTGLANRAHFSSRLGQAFAAARQESTPFAVLCFDLDHFKDVNDTLGHQHGDLLLQTVARRLETCVRQGDVISRLGGDEFALLVIGTDEIPTIETVARRINAILSEPYALDENTAHVSASIGISVYAPSIASPEEMMVQADLALYRTKERGRNNFCFHSSDLDSQVRDRVALTGELHSALQQRELELYYQPQIEIASGRIVGVEVLVHWNHPKRGLLAPEAFIPMAETTGMIVPLGRWLLEECGRQMQAWRDLRILPPTVAINLSTTQLKACPNFELELAAMLGRNGISAHTVELELTEQTLMEADGLQSGVIKRLRSLGCSLAIDDFGTGYSSLNHLTADSVDRLKIAKEFLRDVAGNVGSPAIVRAIIGLARELKIEVIAQGVEDERQLDAVRLAGCSHAQGRYFCPPVPAAIVGGLLADGAIESGRAPFFRVAAMALS
jgi:diguanylate cyclase (GGDEF)-like protein